MTVQTKKSKRIYVKPVNENNSLCFTSADYRRSPEISIRTPSPIKTDRRSLLRDLHISILCVDDSNISHKIYEKIFTTINNKHGSRIISMHVMDGEDLVRIVTKDELQFDLIFTDNNMIFVNGTDAIRELIEYDPDLVYRISMFSDDSSIISTDLHLDYNRLCKPITCDIVLDVIMNYVVDFY